MPSTTLVTADELLAMSGDRRCELIDGVLIDLVPPGMRHGRVALAVGALLHAYAEVSGGIASGEVGFLLRRSPDTVRAPDAAYVGAERAVSVGVTRHYWPGAPDLAVEVVSPGDTHRETHEKALMWLDAGASVVLVVDPDAGHVTRYRSREDIVVRSGDQPIDCEPAMPGFAPTAGELLGSPPTSR